MKTEKISEFVRRLTMIFPRRALIFWDARREKKRKELYEKLIDSDLTLKGLLLQKEERPESDTLERWIRIQSRLVGYYKRKYEKASRNAKIGNKKLPKNKESEGVLQ